VREPAARYPQRKKKSTKRSNMYTHTHTHTSMNVGMYDCKRSESESELGNQLSGILRKENKPCIEEKQRVRPQATSHTQNNNQKQEQIYAYTIKLPVSRRNRNLGNQL
jgi:hypothetical protein